jgi:hypothetical protein
MKDRSCRVLHSNVLRSNVGLLVVTQFETDSIHYQARASATPAPATTTH